MNTSKGPRVAVIGAGVRGLACASVLPDAGFRVRGFDKGRGPGGRASTRRVAVEGKEVDFDHGAQYFTVRHPDLAKRVEHWRNLGVVSGWKAPIAVLRDDGTVESFDEQERYVGTPTMSAICEHLAVGQDVRRGIHVGRVQSTERGSLLFDREERELGVFELVVATAPPAQSAELLSIAAPTLAARVASVRMKPCWALMVAFDSELEVSYGGAFLPRGAPLSWVARTSSKPGRVVEPDRWVVHASAEWSEQRLAVSPERVVPDLLDAMFEATGVPPRTPLWASAHRWRFALAENPLHEGCLFDPVQRVGACGDWAQGNRVEGAFLSGLAMGRRIAASAR